MLNDYYSIIVGHIQVSTDPFPGFDVKWQQEHRTQSFGVRAVIRVMKVLKFKCGKKILLYSQRELRLSWL